MSRTNLTLTDADRDNIRRVREATGATTDREAISRALAEADLRLRKLQLREQIEKLESAIGALSDLAEDPRVAGAYTKLNAVWSDLVHFEDSLL